LKGVLHNTPNDPVTNINLAIVLGRQGKVAEARGVLTRVRQQHAGTRMATRADSVSAAIQ
ncbi:MAG: hypothetical protein JSW58_13440, partial [Candidatus Latescibacterota bacterium]